MSIWTNAKTFLNVGFLAATDSTVTKVFGNYDNAAAAQADVNTLAEILDSGVTVRKFSKRKQERALCLEDILGSEKESTEPKDMKEAFIKWFNSLDDADKTFIKDAIK